MSLPSDAPPTPKRMLGLRENAQQFWLLVLVNAFVGAMVGLERTVVPLIAEAEFNLVSKTVILSFIISFGIVKALSNLFAGRLSDRLGRKPILIFGWLVGLPVPFLIIAAPAWEWIAFANVLLGINQGLCWSTTVIMKIDLVGPKQRGLAMGLNEFAGYLAVSAAAFMTGYLAAEYNLRPVPFYPGFVFAALGLLFSIFLVKETRGHAALEAANLQSAGSHNPPEKTLSFSRVFLITSWKDRALFSVSQAGMINNLNDGMVWGLLPLFLADAGLTMAKIGIIAAAYPAAWGLAQLITGALSDRWGRKWMIVAGMWVQAAGIIFFVGGTGFLSWLLGAIVLGLGTALVYPTLLAAVSDVAHPAWRASAVGVYRLWRDGGYAVGALLSGIIADAMGIPAAIIVIAGLTFLSGSIVALIMYETLPEDRN